MPRDVLDKLRLTVGCALAGAVLTGAVLGHDVAGRDPAYAGAAVGLLLGIMAWRKGTFDGTRGRREDARPPDLTRE